MPNQYRSRPSVRARFTYVHMAVGERIDARRRYRQLKPFPNRRSMRRRPDHLRPGSSAAPFLDVATKGNRDEISRTRSIRTADDDAVPVGGADADRIVRERRECGRLIRARILAPLTFGLGDRARHRFAGHGGSPDGLSLRLDRRNPRRDSNRNCANDRDQCDGSPRPHEIQSPATGSGTVTGCSAFRPRRNTAFTPSSSSV